MTLCTAVRRPSRPERVTLGLGVEMASASARERAPTQKFKLRLEPATIEETGQYPNLFKSKANIAEVSVILAGMPGDSELKFMLSHVRTAFISTRASSGTQALVTEAAVRIPFSIKLARPSEPYTDKQKKHTGLRNNTEACELLDAVFKHATKDGFKAHAAQ